MAKWHLRGPVEKLGEVLHYTDYTILYYTKLYYTLHCNINQYNIYICIYIYVYIYNKIQKTCDKCSCLALRRPSWDGLHQGLFKQPIHEHEEHELEEPEEQELEVEIATLYHIVSHCHDTSHKVCGYANKYRRFKTLERYTASWAPFRALRVQTSGNLDRSKIIRASLVHKGAQSTGSTSSSFVSNWADLLHTVSTPGHISPEMLFLAAKRCHVVPWPSFRHVSFSGRGGRWLGLSCHLFCSGWLQIQRFLPDSWTSRLLKEFHMLSSSDLVIAPLLRTGVLNIWCSIRADTPVTLRPRVNFMRNPPFPCDLHILRDTDNSW